MIARMTPVSYIAHSSPISLDSNFPLVSPSILIKWHPVSAASAIVSWESISSDAMMIPGGVFLFWVVSLYSEEIKGFIVKGLSIYVSFSISLQILTPPPISFTSSNTPTFSPILPSAVVIALSPSLITESWFLIKLSYLGQYVSTFREFPVNVFIFWTLDWWIDWKKTVFIMIPLRYNLVHLASSPDCFPSIIQWGH